MCEHTGDRPVRQSLNMNIFVKSSLKGILGYLLIQVVTCIAMSKAGTSIVAKASDSFILCASVGPFLWIPLLIYPGILLLAISAVKSWKKSAVSPYLISSTFIIYGIDLVLAQYVFELFKKGLDPWTLSLVGIISCFVGFIYTKLRAPIEVN
jgi:hypothetical protein